MKKNKFRITVVLIVIVIFGISIINNANVQASESSYTLTKGGKIYYTSGRYIIKHYFGNTPAYCLQWRLSTINGSKYTLYNPSNMTERNKYIAGYAIKLVEQDYPNSVDSQHLYATMALNCLFGLSGSTCYQAGKEYITKATTYVDTVEKLCEGTNTSGCLNNEKFKLSQSSSTLNQIGTSQDFVSNKITLSGLLKTYGGDGVTYTITATSSSNNEVSICENANGTNCSGSSITLTDTEGNYSFYVRVNNASANSNVKIKATAQNKSTYPYGIAYRYTSSYQALMIKDQKTLERKLSRTSTLNVPDKSKHTITARKVDENGEDLNGATFEVYRADLETGEEISILKQNQDGLPTLSYIEEEFTNKDDWFKYKYCLRETKAPAGYIYDKQNEIENPLCMPAGNKWNNGSYCYNSENEEVEDLEKCNSHTLQCSSSQGEMIEGTSDCRLTSKIQEETTNAQAICPDGYTLNTNTNKCEYEKKEENITSETTTSKEQTSSLEDTSDKEVSYVCKEGEERVEDSETGNVSCIIKTCDTNNGYVLDESLNSCVKITEASICHSDRSAYEGEENVDMSYCNDQASYTYVTINSGNIDFVKTNNRNNVIISKTDITGEKELPGAKMKICTTKPNSNLECEIAKITKPGECSQSSLDAKTCTNNSDNTMNIEVSWISDIAPRSIRGLEANKTYYLVETVAPLGYAISQYTEFLINDDGSVVSGNSVVENGKILVKNDLSKFSISKQDMATKKELPGAEITICYAGIDENGEYKMGTDEEGNCTVPVLANGEDAKWISTDKPHTIEGLPAGAYYLVETITPDGYDTAEKILFLVNQDGTITDKDGNSIKDNKIIMYDDPLKQTPTGDLKILLILILGFFGIGTGIYLYQIKFKKTKLS